MTKTPRTLQPFLQHGLTRDGQDMAADAPKKAIIVTAFDEYAAPETSSRYAWAEASFTHALTASLVPFEPHHLFLPNPHHEGCSWYDQLPRLSHAQITLQQNDQVKSAEYHTGDDAVVDALSMTVTLEQGGESRKVERLTFPLKVALILEKEGLGALREMTILLSQDHGLDAAALVELLEETSPSDIDVAQRFSYQNDLGQTLYDEASHNRALAAFREQAHGRVERLLNQHLAATQ